MGIKGTGNMIRLTASKEVKQAVARKLLPTENRSEKYSVTTQMNLPLSSEMSLPFQLESMRSRYKDLLGEVEVRIVQAVMLSSIDALKYAIYSKQHFAFISHTSKVMSLFLWDMVKLWWKSCGLVVEEDIREVVLIEDAANQGSKRVKLMFGARLYWSKVDEDVVKTLNKLQADYHSFKGLRGGFDVK